MAVIKLRTSTTASAVPAAAALITGEVAVNLADKIIYAKDGAGNVVEIGRGLGFTPFNFSANTPWHSGNFDAAKVLRSKGNALQGGNLDTLSVTDSEIFSYHPGNGANTGDPSGRPSYGTLAVISAAAFSTQIIFPDSGSNTTGMFHRTRYSQNGWGAWARVWDSLNFDPNSKANLSGAAFSGSVSVGSTTIHSNGRIYGAGAAQSYGTLTIQGEKNGWSGIELRNSADQYCGTIMATSGNNGGIYREGWNWQFQWDGSGNVTATGNVTAYSDERLKDNFSEEVISLDEMASVKAESFDRIDIPGTRQVGGRAQAFQKIVPLAVQTNADDLLSVDYGRFATVISLNLAREVLALREEVRALKASLCK